MPEIESSSAREQAALQMEGRAKIEALKKLNAKRRQADTAPTENFSALKTEREVNRPEETLEEKLERSRKTGEAIILSAEQSNELRSQMRAEDQKKIAEIRQDIGQVGKEETTDTSPWKPEGESPRFGGTAAQN